MQLASFLQWWRDGLLAPLPHSWREPSPRSFQRQKPEVSIRANKESGFEVRFSSADNNADWMPLRTTGEDDRTLRLLKKKIKKGHHLNLRLNSQDCLRKQIKLPASYAQNLRPLLTSDIDQYTPFQAHQIYFDYAIEPSKEVNSIDVDILLAPRELVDASLELLNDFQLGPNRISPADQAATSFLNLLPGSETEPSNKTSWALTVPALAAIILATGALFFVTHLKEQQLSNVRAVYKKLANELHQLDLVNSQYGEAARDALFILEEKNNSSLVLESLAQTSLAVSDDTWLRQLTMVSKNLTLEGETKSSASLLRQIEASPMLQNVELAAPVSHDENKNTERFRLSAGIIANTDN